jgi:hypothetical protein
LYDTSTAEKNAGEWQPISTAPLDCDLELSVINYDGVHALLFPCHRIHDGWLKAGTKERLDLQPTHWREWTRRL